MARCACKQTCSCKITPGDCIVDPIPGTGALDNPYIISVEVVPNGGVNCTPAGLTANITHTDTTCIKLTGDGGLNPLAATLDVADDIPDPNGGPNPGNGLECSGTGASVSPSVEAGNTLRFGTDGRLYVAPGSTKVDTDSTDCLNLQISGTGSLADPFVISGTPIIAPEPNGVECTPTGLSVIPATDANNVLQFGITDPGHLYVPPSPTVVKTIQNDPTQTEIVGPNDTITFACVPVPITASTVVGAPCLSASGDTCTGFNFQLGISPDPCNGIVCNGNGLFSFHDPAQLPLRNTLSIAGQSAGPFNGNVANVIVGNEICATLTNPSTCRFMSFTGDLGTSIRFTKAGGDIVAEAAFGPPGGPYAGAGGRIGLTGGGAASSQLASFVQDLEFGLVAPGATVTVCMKLQVTTNAAVNATIDTAAYTISLRGRWNN